MTSRPRSAAIVGWVLLALSLAGCVPGPVSTPTTASSPATTPADPDFTEPGVAQSMVESLLTDAGSRQALMVEITMDSVQVSVLAADGKPVTWAHRDGKSAEVTSDLAYVDQATFEVSKFNISHVGGLFRAAASMSGSEEKQSLTIVDYSGGEVMMSVSTFPESRTVFFNPDGSLLAELNFDTPDGVAEGIKEAVGLQLTIYSVTVQSDQGVWADYPGNEEGTTVRRTRTAKVPATINIRNETPPVTVFVSAKIRPDAVWKVLDSVRGTRVVASDAPWRVVIEDRDSSGIPRMYFTIGSTSLTTDLNGSVIS